MTLAGRCSDLRNLPRHVPTVKISLKRNGKNFSDAYRRAPAGAPYRDSVTIDGTQRYNVSGLRYTWRASYVRRIPRGEGRRERASLLKFRHPRPPPVRQPRVISTSEIPQRGH